MKEHKKGLLSIFIAAVLWSTGGLFIKLISLDAFQLSFFRSLFSAITLLVIFRKDVIKFNKGTIVNGLFYSAILILFVLAAKTTTVANAIFLQYTAPIYVLIFEPIFLKTRFEKINLVTIVICFIGMSLFFMGKLSPGDMEGNIIALLSGVAFAVFLLGMRKNDHQFQFATIFYGNIFISLICLFSLNNLGVIIINDLYMVAYLGIFQIGIAYVIFSYGLKKVQAIEASLISMIEPVLNPIWTYFGYGEEPSIFAIIGGIIILLAVLIRALEFDKYIFVKNQSRS